MAGNVNVQQYSKVIKTAARVAHMPNYSAHGPRAGYVSDAVLEGEPFIEIQETGRWLNPKSLRIYMDACSVIQQVHAGAIAPWVRAAKLISHRPELFFFPHGYPAAPLTAGVLWWLSRLSSSSPPAPPPTTHSSVLCRYPGGGR